MINRNVYTLRNTVATLLSHANYDAKQLTFTPFNDELVDAVSFEIFSGERILDVHALPNVVYVVVANDVAHNQVSPQHYFSSGDVPFVNCRHSETLNLPEVIVVIDDVKRALIGL